MARSLTWRDVWQQRLAAHSLAATAPADQLIDVVGAVCGIHAQVASSAELSVCLRLDGIRQAQVRAALWTERSLVKTYGLRGTLHIFPAHEVALWLAALAPGPATRGAGGGAGFRSEARRSRHVRSARPVERRPA